MLNLILRFVLGTGVLLALLFGSAGRWDLPFVWAYLAVLVGSTFAGWLLMDPGLIRERMKPGPGGTDRALRWVVLPFFAAHLFVAGLDAGRFHWSVLPRIVQLVALVPFAAAMTLSVWSCYANRFFSPVVRIQAERGHRVVTGGPYRWIRHPGYAAACLMILSSGVVLGSYWSMLPLAPVLVLIFRRIIIEDRYLRAELEGYAAYADRVRFRLVPGIW